MTNMLRSAMLVALVFAVHVAVSEVRADDVVARGAFYDGPHAPQHRLSGEAVILRDEDGRYRLEITDLSSDQGPDLYFIVSTAENPTKDTHIRASDWEIIARRKALTGDQSYVLQSFDPARHRSVALWCKQYSVMFGAAALTTVEEQP